MNALTEFTKNRGTSFYDDMMSGSLPVPVITEEIDKIEFFDENLQDAASDNNQPLAVKRALGNQKITLIQGPPGTGKTTVIVEIIRQLVKQGKKILVCSQAHAAVDNIVEKLKKIPVEEQEIISRSKEIKYDYKVFGINFKREILYERINQRVDIMIKQGLEQEVRNLISKYNYFPTAMQGLGYKEVVEYIKGIITYEEMVEKIKQETRRYAKRQMTWFRKNKDIIWLNGEDDINKNVNIILSY